MARIVVAGGGVVGASIAYHLARKGARDVVLAEAGRIASGASGKALGGVRQQFSSAPEVRLARESVAFFHELGGGLFEAVDISSWPRPKPVWPSSRSAARSRRASAFRL